MIRGFLIRIQVKRRGKATSPLSLGNQPDSSSAHILKKTMAEHRVRHQTETWYDAKGVEVEGSDGLSKT